MPTDSFEELFKMAKEAVDVENAEEEVEAEITEETLETADKSTEDSKEEESKTTARGNYSNASLDDLWKNLK